MLEGILGAASLASGLLGSGGGGGGGAQVDTTAIIDAINKAVEAQKQGGANATSTLNEYFPSVLEQLNKYYGKAESVLSPYTNTGTAALNKYNATLGLPTVQYLQYQQELPQKQALANRYSDVVSYLQTPGLSEEDKKNRYLEATALQQALKATPNSYWSKLAQSTLDAYDTLNSGAATQAQRDAAQRTISSFSNSVGLGDFVVNPAQRATSTTGQTSNTTGTTGTGEQPPFINEGWSLNNIRFGIPGSTETTTQQLPVNSKGVDDSLLGSLSSFDPTQYLNYTGDQQTDTQGVLTDFFNNPLYQLQFGGTGSAVDPNASPLDRFQASPGYQFRLDQGQKALEQSAASRGLLESGNFAKALQDYGQGQASQEWNSYMGNLTNTFSTYQNQLAQLAGLGQNTATNQANLYAQQGNATAGAYGSQGSNIANIDMATAAGVASGYLNQANLLGQAASAQTAANAQQSAMGQQSQNSMMNGLFNAGLGWLQGAL